MQQVDFAAIVGRAMLAPSVHNTQPARWRLDGDTILVGCDTGAILPAGDPEGRDAGLSCGAAVEAAALALSATGHGVQVTDLWNRGDHVTLPGTRLAARMVIDGHAAADPLADQLERRFTFRGAFALIRVPDWQQPDAVLVTDPDQKAWIARVNDQISLETLRNVAVRQELLHWMRLSPRHPRYAHDGMNRAALRLSAPLALGAGLTLGPLWGICDRLGLTPLITAEAAATRTAAVIACFHRPAGESPVTTGRAYLRLCLQAAARGMAGWPMAAVADDPQTRALVAARYGIGSDRRLVQVIRFGPPVGQLVGQMPPRARRPLTEVIV